MYNLDISELKWKHRPGPTGDTCSISIKCYVPTIDKTELLVRSDDIIAVAQAINAAYADVMETSYIEDNVYTATFTGIITLQQIENTLADVATDTITVLNSQEAESDADPNVFVYHAIDEADSIIDSDLFACIASKYDMDTLPVGEPVLLDDLPTLYEAIPFYRLDTIDMDFLNANEAHRFIKLVKKDVGLLVREINNAGKYTLRHTVHI